MRNITQGTRWANQICRPLACTKGREPDNGSFEAMRKSQQWLIKENFQNNHIEILIGFDKFLRDRMIKREVRYEDSHVVQVRNDLVNWMIVHIQKIVHGVC